MSTTQMTWNSAEYLQNTGILFYDIIRVLKKTDSGKYYDILHYRFGTKGRLLYSKKVEVKQSLYMHGVAQRVPGS